MDMDYSKEKNMRAKCFYLPLKQKKQQQSFDELLLPGINSV
jgi:hypothetical protein